MVMYKLIVNYNGKIMDITIQKAAMAGDSFGFYLMGIVYENGYGVKRNKEKAAQLFEIAAYMGYGPAKEKINKIIPSNPDSANAYRLAYTKAQIKYYLSDIVPNASDKILDNKGSKIAGVVGGILAETILSIFDTD